MAVPRPILLALLGTVLLAATFMATRNSKSVSEKQANPAAPAKPQAAAPASATKPGALSAQDAVRAMVAPGTPVNSARFSLRISARELGGKRRNQSASYSGSFAPGPPSGPVGFDVSGSDRKESVHVVSAAGKAFALEGADAYQLPDSPKRAAASRKAIAGKDRAAKLPSVDPGPWFRNLKAEPGAKVAGVATTHVSGTLDSTHMARDVRELVRSAAKTAQQPVTLPRGFGGMLAKAFRGARLDASVGTADKVVRRVRIARAGAFPAAMLDKGDSSRWRLALSLSVSDVNKPQKIAAPDKARATGLSRRERRTADGAFITSAIALDPPAGVAQMAATYLRVAAEARARRVPRAVERSIRAHHKVVIFFSQARSVDDPITAHAVAALRRRSKASIYTDGIDNLAAYGQVVQSVGVTRAPSIVIVGRKGRARLVDGYIDPRALAQEVADTR